MDPMMAMMLAQGLQGFADNLGAARRGVAPPQKGGAQEMIPMMSMMQRNQMAQQQFAMKQQQAQEEAARNDAAARALGVDPAILSLNPSEFGKNAAEASGVQVLSPGQRAMIGERVIANNPALLQAVTGGFANLQDGTYKKDSGLFASELAKAAAGRSQTNVNVTNPIQSEFDKKVMGQAADLYLEAQNEAKSSRTMANEFGAINDLLANTPDTGRGWEQARLKFAKSWNSLTGMDLKAEDIATKEAANSLVNQFALKARSPGGPLGGLPGSASDKDVEFLTSIPPGIETTPQGRQLMTDVQKAKADHAEERAAAVREYTRAQKGNVDPYDIQAFQQAYDKSHPIFDGIRRKYDFGAESAQIPAAAAQPAAPIAPAAQAPSSGALSPNAMKYLGQ